MSATKTDTRTHTLIQTSFPPWSRASFCAAHADKAEGHQAQYLAAAAQEACLLQHRARARFLVALAPHEFLYAPIGQQQRGALPPVLSRLVGYGGHPSCGPQTVQ